MAQTAADQASSVASDAKSEAKDLARTAKNEVNTQVETQRRRLVDVLRTTGDEIGGSHDDHSALTSELARRASDQARLFADYLDDHGPEDILADVRRFARRRPGTFLLLAGVAGVVAGRVFRGVKEGDSPESAAASTPSRLTSPPTTATPIVEPAIAVDEGSLGEGTTYRTGTFVDDSAVTSLPAGLDPVDPHGIAVGTAAPVPPVLPDEPVSDTPSGYAAATYMPAAPGGAAADPVTPADSPSNGNYPSQPDDYPPADTTPYRPPVAESPYPGGGATPATDPAGFGQPAETLPTEPVDPYESRPETGSEYQPEYRREDRP